MDAECTPPIPGVKIMTTAPLQDNDCRTFSVLVENRFGVPARDFGIIDMARSGRVAIARCRE